MRRVCFWVVLAIFYPIVCHATENDFQSVGITASAHGHPQTPRGYNAEFDAYVQKAQSCTQQYDNCVANNAVDGIHACVQLQYDCNCRIRPYGCPSWD